MPLRSLIVALLYGAGLRLSECLDLRVKDVDFGANQIVVRNGKGGKDRVTMLPAMVKGRLARHLEAVRGQHQRDLAQGLGAVVLPEGIALGWPASATCADRCRSVVNGMG